MVERNLEKISYKLPTRVTFSNASASLDAPTLNLCLTNRLDKDHEPVFLGVPMAKLDMWNNLTLTGKQLFDADTATDPLSYSIELQPLVGSRPIGKMTFSFSEMVSGGKPLIMGVDPDFDREGGCDLFTGTLALRKYNFIFYFIEYDTNYAVKFTFDTYIGNT